MIQDPIMAAIEKYKRPLVSLRLRSILKLKIKHIDDKKMAVVLKVLNAKKAKQENDAPIKLIKENSFFPLFSLECLTFKLTKHLLQIA